MPAGGGIRSHHHSRSPPPRARNRVPLSSELGTHKTVKVHDFKGNVLKTFEVVPSSLGSGEGRATLLARSMPAGVSAATHTLDV